MTGLDLTPLERGAGLRDRLRSLGSSPLLLAATTIGVLLVVAPLLGMLAAVLVAGPTDRGLLFFLSLLVVCGIWVILDGLRKAGTGARLETFARANDLELTRSLAAREYAGSRFRSGERIVLHSLRTRTAPALEVGDTWPLQRVRVRVSSRGAVSAANPPAAEGFLRVVVHDPHGQRPEEFPMTAQLDAAIGGLLGPYRLEVGDGEVTVMGSVPLEPSRSESVTAAFEIAAALARQAGAVPVTGTGDPAAPAHATPRRAANRSTRHPLTIIAAVLAMMVVVPVAFAIAMSILDDFLPRDEWMAGAVLLTVLSVLLIGITAVVGAVIRWATAVGRRRRGEVDRSAPREGSRAPRP